MTADVKRMNIKNRIYYFFDDMIDIKEFDSSLLQIDRISYENIEIYCIGYITIIKNDDYNNIHSVNPLYLLTHSATGHIKEKK